MASQTRVGGKENHRQSLTLPKLNRGSFGRVIRALHRSCGKHCRKSCEKRSKARKTRASKQNAQACGRTSQIDQNERLVRFPPNFCIATCAHFRHSPLLSTKRNEICRPSISCFHAQFTRVCAKLTDLFDYNPQS